MFRYLKLEPHTSLASLLDRARSTSALEDICWQSQVVLRSKVILKEQEGALTASLDLPGVDPANISIEQTEGRLRLTIKDESGDNVLDPIPLDITIPDGVNKDAITATCRHGRLTITFPRTPPQTRVITVTADGA